MFNIFDAVATGIVLLFAIVVNLLFYGAIIFGILYGLNHYGVI